MIINSIIGLDILPSLRTNDFSEPIAKYLEIAISLEKTGQNIKIARAKFIRQQCNSESGKELFDMYRENWGIFNFDENLVDVGDYKRGFFWCFRDHTTSWSDSERAKDWFLTSPEALFVRRYEFWTFDNGYDECIEVKEGSYKEILISLLTDGDYSILRSPIFSRNELLDFIANYIPKDGDFLIEEIIEDYIQFNPNYQA